MTNALSEFRQAFTCELPLPEIFDVLATEQFVKMRDAIVAFLRENNSGTASELREFLGTTRRVIIPFLERLDRDGVTRRIADKRVLVKPN